MRFVITCGKPATRTVSPRNAHARTPRRTTSRNRRGAGLRRSRRDRRPSRPAASRLGQHVRRQRFELALFGGNVDGRRRTPSRRRARRGRRPAAPGVAQRQTAPPPRRPIRRNGRRLRSRTVCACPARGFAARPPRRPRPADGPPTARRRAPTSAARRRSSICSTNSASSGTNAEVFGRFDAARSALITASAPASDEVSTMPAEPSL